MDTRSVLRLAGFWTAILILPASAQDSEIVLSGHINEAMAARVHGVLQDGRTHNVAVNSSGGENLPALAIARDIAKSRSMLIVTGACAGPCANYLFATAARRTVLPGALVIFSATATSRRAMVAPQRLREVRPDNARAAEQEKQLGASVALLLEPQLKLATQCYSLTSRDGAGRAYVNYRSSFIGWVPSRAYLARAGIRFTGFWPKNSAQFQSALKAAFPGGLRGEVRFAGSDAPPPMSKLMADLAAIPECDKGPDRARRP